MVRIWSLWVLTVYTMWMLEIFFEYLNNIASCTLLDAQTLNYDSETERILVLPYDFEY